MVTDRRMESETLQAPPSPLRWSYIPFRILEDLDERQSKKLRAASAFKATCIDDIPEPILVTIFTCIIDPRTRNSMAVVCMEWYRLERATRTTLCLRGCVSDLYLIPRSFKAVEVLDLSHCSPWGYSLFQTSAERAIQIGHALKLAFPRVKDMKIYARDSRDIDMVAAFWPALQSLKLVRWHQRPTQPEEASGLGMEFRFLMETCKSLRNIDLSEFYCWTEDIPHALQVEQNVCRNLRSLNLMKVSDGFKATELEAITNACMNLEELWIVLVFDSRFLDFVGDDALLNLGLRCKKLRVLHLIDSEDFNHNRGDPEHVDEEQDAKIGKHGLIGMFQALPSLEDLAIVLSQNIRDSSHILEALATQCKNLTALSLGHFQGLCKGPQRDGLAICTGLTELVIKCCADIDDIGLLSIATSNNRLRKLGLHCCRGMTKAGLRMTTYQLCQTLVSVQVSCCIQLDSIDTLWALQPIQRTVRELHIDYMVDSQAKIEAMTPHCALSSSSEAEKKCTNNIPQRSDPSVDMTSFNSNTHASVKVLDLNFSTIENGNESIATNSRTALDSGTMCLTPPNEASTVNKELSYLKSGVSEFSLDFCRTEWSRLKCLSVWIPNGELLSLLPTMGLSMCPCLEKIQIKVEGDCRACPKPRYKNSGLSTFKCYPTLSKLTLDCSEIVGYALSAPKGHMELSSWERWYLQGIDCLSLQELDYWPPQDRDANRRGISLPSAGLISQCQTLRKLILHGTINEHLLRMFLKISNLRDVQLRIDYYPAPEIDLNTEMRVDACRRFEAALSARGFPD